MQRAVKLAIQIQAIMRQVDAGRGPIILTGGVNRVRIFETTFVECLEIAEYWPSARIACASERIMGLMDLYIFRIFMET
jgi:hypothetical protein